MAVRITIENLRHIRRLEFSIPNTGVWLLTGANGTGKTSLLACLRRIGYSNAFPTHFPASQKSDRLDSFDGSSVRYDVNGAAVTYRYRGERWVPLPKANSKLLSQAGFPSVRYIAADATRIEPNKDDFQPRRVRPAHGDIIAAANRIFDTGKFNALKTINLRTGVGSDAFLLELPTVPGRNVRHYISEKNLSLGELCILKLLRLLKDCPRGSLVLIDELELALHPMAQVTLLRYLDDIAAEKALTIIVSTHSATLIKQANASRLLLLQEDAAGNIVCQDKCFPSLVLGALAYREETAADVIVYVEDEAAQVLVEQFAFRFMQQVYQNHQLAPSIQVIPVGGMTNVLRFFVRQRPLLPAITRCYVMLDADAEQTLNTARAEDIIRIRDRERAAISYLPVTPEVGLASFLHGSIRAVQDALRTHYRLQIAVVQQDVGALPEPDDREACKTLVSRVCGVIAEQLPNVASSDVKETLLKMLANHLFENEQARIMRLMGPIIRG
ncbi:MULTISPECIES: ATP-dependent endonuclease [Burkholderia]|uniref:ATP-binding protein n=1 Tax=Burkholderia aenigmatica TaxID=2015348 RepID=A0A6J5JL67_9BURK|nr:MULTISPECIES: AAA family ATPase [Burkholderia]CAB3972614.1 ATP-binding protein [Burkholderia aenigmatica]